MMTRKDNMYCVYILKSRKNGRKYVGLTGRKVEERLAEHNAGRSPFTKQNTPFDLVYFEEHTEKSFALKRERFFKTGHGRECLKRFIPLSRQVFGGT